MHLNIGRVMGLPVVQCAQPGRGSGIRGHRESRACLSW